MPMNRSFQTQMALYMDAAPHVDDEGLIDNIAYKRYVQAKTAAYTVKTSESGGVFTTEGATAAVTFTLPAVEDGLEYYFVNAEDVNMVVAAPTANTVITFNNASTADSVTYSTASELIGGSIWAFSDGTSWFLIGIGAGGHLQTLTVTTA